jgi:hypothetical protein
MLVGLQGESDVGVTESLADHLDRDAFFEEQASMGVAEVVEADRRDLGVVDDAPERFVDGVGMDGSAVAVGEHPLVAVVDADCGELGRLVGPPTFEDRERRLIEVDGATGSLGLASGLVNLVADCDEPPVEVQAALVDVDVGPLQAEDLVADDQPSTVRVGQGAE